MSFYADWQQQASLLMVGAACQGTALQLLHCLMQAGASHAHKKPTLKSADTTQAGACCQKQLTGQACCIDREFQVGS